MAHIAIVKSAASSDVFVFAWLNSTSPSGYHAIHYDHFRVILHADSVVPSIGLLLRWGRHSCLPLLSFVFFIHSHLQTVHFEIRRVLLHLCRVEHFPVEERLARHARPTVGI